MLPGPTPDAHQLPNSSCRVVVGSGTLVVHKLPNKPKVAFGKPKRVVGGGGGWCRRTYVRARARACTACRCRLGSWVGTVLLHALSLGRAACVGWLGLA